MNTPRLALPTAALLTLVPVLAVAEPPPPSWLQLYGSVDLALVHFDGIQDPNNSAATTSINGLSPGSNASSKIGVKGQRDLGQGLSGEFAASVSYCASGYTKGRGLVIGSGLCDAGILNWGQTMAGIGASWGKVKLGRLKTPQAQAEGDFDAFGDGFVGQVGNLSLLGANAAEVGVTKANQAITYETPAFGDWQGSLLLSNDASTSKTALVQTGGNKPTSVSLDWHGSIGKAALGLNVGRFNSVLPVASGSSNFGDYDLWMLYGSYDFGGPKLFAIGQNGSARGFNGAQRLASVGLSVPQGAGTWMVSYAQRWDSIVAAPSTLATSSARQYALGYRVPLATGLTVYGAWARILNDQPGPNRLGTAYTVGDSSNGFNGVAGQASSGLSAGLTLEF